MKKGRHIHTDFIKFLLEKYSETKNQDEELETPELEDEDEKDECEDEIEDEDNNNPDQEEEVDEVIEKLLTEYKKVKKQYENNRIQIKRKK